MKKARELFEKRARLLGDVDLSRGIYGEWLNQRTRDLWFLWCCAVRDGATGQVT